MDDVKPNAVEPQAETPAEQPTQAVEQTPETPDVTPTVEPEVQPERMVPLAELQQERKRRQEAQRKLAEQESSAKLSNYSPEDLDTILQHPMVQDLIIKDARRELTDYAREVLEKYPGFPEIVKKAILKNARGFVNEATTDIETAKVDLLEAIEEYSQEVKAEPNASKGFPVAATSIPTPAGPTVKSTQIDAILNKDINDWSDDDVAAVEEYSKKTK